VVGSTLRSLTTHDIDVRCHYPHPSNGSKGHELWLVLSFDSGNWRIPPGAALESRPRGQHPDGWFSVTADESSWESFLYARTRGGICSISLDGIVWSTMGRSPPDQFS
jgi:hypothetical protein